MHASTELINGVSRSLKSDILKHASSRQIILNRANIDILLPNNNRQILILLIIVHCFYYTFSLDIDKNNGDFMHAFNQFCRKKAQNTETGKKKTKMTRI